MSQLERHVEFLYSHLGLTPPEPADGVSTAVRELVLQGNAIAAIKLYREESGADLQTAHAVIQSLTR